MRHVVLLGDSIFDNASYVPGNLPVIDLRMVCMEPLEYSVISPIEPSAAGGEKIVRAIVHLLENHDFEFHRSSVYT